jgi:hypothetical protein
METVALNDKDVFPTEAIIFHHIGKYKSHWISLFDFIHTCYPAFTENWNYYLDGKRWLLKVTHKSKTVFWLSLFEKSFRLTFYFNMKYEEQIEHSDLPDEVKEQFTTAKLYNKIKAITIHVKSKKDVEIVKELIEKKLLLK